MDPGASSTAKLSFVANDMFLPITAATHNPYGFTNLAAMYSHFTVVKATLKVNAINASGYKMFLNVNVYPGDNLIDDTIPALMEQPGSKYLLLSPDNAGTGSSSGEISYTVDMPRFFGRSYSALVGAADYRGTASSSPVELAWLIIAARSTSTADPGVTQILAEITYTAVWTEPLKFSQA